MDDRRTDRFRLVIQKCRDTPVLLRTLGSAGRRQAGPQEGLLDRLQRREESSWEDPQVLSGEDAARAAVEF
jgi:hypothetical protein